MDNRNDYLLDSVFLFIKPLWLYETKQWYDVKIFIPVVC